MVVFNTDLDNTLIYSYKHDIGANKVNVEIYQGREISFMSAESYELLKLVNQKMLVVPTTTRTIEQYNRIDLGIGVLPYVLACNGGILLVNGARDEQWYQESLKLIEESNGELQYSLEILEADSRRTFDLRFIENLFVFTKCDTPEVVVEDLRKVLNTDYVDVFNNGVKVYVVPKALNKGVAVNRFRDYIKAEYVVAAGDSEFDISLLEAADFAIAPSGFTEKYGIDFVVNEASEKELFSDVVLNRLLQEQI